MVEWLVVFFIIIAVVFLVGRYVRKRKPAPTVKLKISGGRAWLKSRQIQISFSIDRTNLEKLLSLKMPSKEETEKRKKRKKPWIWKRPWQKPSKASKPNCFGELKLGLPEMDECAECDWKEDCQMEKTNVE